MHSNQIQTYIQTDEGHWNAFESFELQKATKKI